MVSKHEADGLVFEADERLHVFDAEGEEVARLDGRQTDELVEWLRDARA